MRRTVVELCANGDFTNSKEFQIYIDGDFKIAEVKHMLCTEFVKAVAGTPPRVYPRHRWTGVQRTLECPTGLLFHLHGLFEVVFEKCAQLHHVAKQSVKAW